MIKNIILNNKTISYIKYKLNNKFILYIANVPELESIQKSIRQWIINLNLTEDILQKSWLLNSFLIFKNIFFEIYGLYIGGSRALNINSENSDLDIIIILSNKYVKFLQSIITYQFPLFYLEDIDTGLYAHYYFHSEDVLINYVSYFNIWVIEAFLNRTKNLVNSLIIHKNKVDNFFNLTLKKAFNSSLQIIKNSNIKLLEKVKNNDLTWLSKRLSKEIVHLAIINCLLQNKKIDKEKIIKLKEYSKLNCERLLIDPPINFEPTVIQYLKDNLIELKDYFDKTK